MPARGEHPRHLLEEVTVVRVEVRGFDVDHRVEAVLGERQILGIALHERQLGQIVAPLAEGNPRGIQVKSRIRGGAKGTRDVRGRAAVAATDLQHPLALEIHLRRDAVIELDAEPIDLVGCRKGQAHRRVLLVAPIEEEHFVVAEPAGDQAISVFPDKFSEPPVRKADYLRHHRAVNLINHRGQYFRCATHCHPHGVTGENAEVSMYFDQQETETRRSEVCHRRTPCTFC